MQATLLDPLVPAEVDLRGFETMPLAVQMLRDSRFASEVTPEAFRAGVLLWCAAWHQVPAGSLPDNDAELAKLAGYGFVVKEWRKVKQQAMTKFIACSDGRWYHEEIAERALTAWRARLEHFYERAKERLRKANKARSDKGLQPLAELTFDQWNERRLSGGIPMEKADAFRELPPEVPPESGTESGKLPGLTSLKGEGTERERKGEGKLLKKNPSGSRPLAQPPDLLGDVPEQPKPTVPCPYGAIVDAYHAELPTLPKVRLRDGKTWELRQKAMRSLWGWVLSSRKSDNTRRAETAEQALQWITAYFARARDNDFVMGRQAPGNGHENWRADFDFLLSANGLKHVIEKTQERAA